MTPFEFDIIGFHSTTAGVYGNLKCRLGIPLRAADRNDSDPYRCGGGIACNLEPWRPSLISYCRVEEFNYETRREYREHKVSKGSSTISFVVSAIWTASTSLRL